MIKVIVHFAKIVIAATLALLCSSCGFEKVQGSGNVITQNRNITESFDAVSASSGLDVEIEQSSETAVIVKADDNLQEHIKTEVHGSELKISCDVNIGNAGAKKVLVKVSSLKSIESSSGCTVMSKGTMNADSMDLSSSSGSSLEVTVDSQSVSCEASSGSSLTVSGKSGRLKAKSSSGSTINAKKLIAEKIDAEASSGASTGVNPTESLSAKASSGGSVTYVQTPSELNKKTSSGGSVSAE